MAQGFQKPAVKVAQPQGSDQADQAVKGNEASKTRESTAMSTGKKWSKSWQIDYEKDEHYEIRRSTLCAHPDCDRGLCKDKMRTVNFCCLICEKIFFDPSCAINFNGRHGGMCTKSRLDTDGPRAQPIPVDEALKRKDWPFSMKLLNEKMNVPMASGVKTAEEPPSKRM